MKKEFENYLIERGYQQFTPRGLPSTVYDYSKRIEKVLEWENLTWQQLAKNIAEICDEYDIGGIKEELGKQSHNAVINALKRFQEYCCRFNLTKSV